MSVAMAPKKRAKSSINWATTLREIRYKLGNISQTEAADKLRVTQRAWSAWETGEKIPSPAMQLLIQLVFKAQI